MINKTIQCFNELPRDTIKLGLSTIIPPHLPFLTEITIVRKQSGIVENLQMLLFVSHLIQHIQSLSTSVTNIGRSNSVFEESNTSIGSIYHISAQFTKKMIDIKNSIRNYLLLNQTTYQKAEFERNKVRLLCHHQSKSISVVQNALYQNVNQFTPYDRKNDFMNNISLY